MLIGIGLVKIKAIPVFMVGVLAADRSLEWCQSAARDCPT